MPHAATAEIRHNGPGRSAPAQLQGQGRATYLHKSVQACSRICGLADIEQGQCKSLRQLRGALGVGLRLGQDGQVKRL